SGDRRRVAYAHNMLANSYVELGRLKRAALHRHAALRLYDELGDVPGQAAANNNLGSCYQLLGILDRALHHYQLSLAACQRMGNPVGEAIVRNNMGEVLPLGHRRPRRKPVLEQPGKEHETVCLAQKAPSWRRCWPLRAQGLFVGLERNANGAPNGSLAPEYGKLSCKRSPPRVRGHRK
ncbi:MAG: tetratricopeptide repeat protein, partial [Chloroflexota bacterium]|nr:tetratricopeptide repeat protein [Chloroflexota bacterium]